MATLVIGGGEKWDMGAAELGQITALSQLDARDAARALNIASHSEAAEFE
ncbi:MAG TPA: hypothetical protein VER33_16960 [Polyangiaceae bacterium]|nr:hypothetical protein [Polyangiaceae bacterium]